MITGIGHVAVSISDLDRALDFYCGKLGFKEAFRLEQQGEPEPWIVYIQVAPATFIELFPGSASGPSEVAQTAHYDHISLSVDDMEATLRELAARGLPIKGRPTMGMDGNWQYWIEDPDGNQIELMQTMPDSPQAAAAARWLAP